MNEVKLPNLNIGEKIKHSDGTEYVRMPNGELRRMSPRAFQIRKIAKKSK